MPARPSRFGARAGRLSRAISGPHTLPESSLILHVGDVQDFWRSDPAATACPAIEEVDHRMVGLIK
jgi:hypothetical protein